MIKIDLIKSKNFDFLKFPKCLFQEEHFTEVSSLNNYKEVIEEDYFKMLNYFKEILAPFTREIELFYPREFNNFDFIDLILNAYPVNDDFEPIKYLKKILNEKASDLRVKFIESLADFEDIGEEKIKEFKQNGDLIELMSDLPLDSSLKWNLMLVFQYPHTYIHKFIDLMVKIKPIFENEYEKHHQELTKFKTFFEKYLNENGLLGLQELSNSLVNINLLKNENPTIILSSFIPYSIILYDHENLKIIVWGLKIADALQKIKEINENRLLERTQVFKLLGDKTKYEVLKYISQGITQTKTLASLTKVSSATISYHINTFLTTKLIKLDNVNKKFSYVVDYEVLDEMINEFKKDLNFPNKE